jgi:Xaa-Pro aminopeptidase
MTEFDQKQNRIQALLAQRRLDALLLQRVSSFAWATCGAASCVNTAITSGEATLLITPSGGYLITNNIEATRLEQEERLAEQGWEFSVAPWHEAQDAVAELTRGVRLGAMGPTLGPPTFPATWPACVPI